MRHGQARARILALVLVFGFAAGLASRAYASTESTYTTWTDPGFDHTKPHDTPHNGYATTSTKCSVCHAVHKAPAAGEVLLRTTVGEACVYCHIDTNLGVIQIYNGDSSLYYDENKNNHSLAGGASCVGCHSVHGANTYGTSIATKILKRLPIQPEFVSLFSATNDPNALYEAVGVDMGHIDEQNHMFPVGTLSWEDWNHVRQVQQTAFCTGCHPYYTRNDGTDPITVEGVQYNSHPMKRYWNSVDGDGNVVVDFQAPGSTLPPGTMVAQMSTNGCYRCHGENLDVDLGPGLQESSFPHYSAHRQRFLISSWWQSNGGRLEDTLDSREDGTCLYCHSWDYPPYGVGVNY